MNTTPNTKTNKELPERVLYLLLIYILRVLKCGYKINAVRRIALFDWSGRMTSNNHRCFCADLGKESGENPIFK
jgi:hypothetical protein